MKKITGIFILSFFLLFLFSCKNSNTTTVTEKENKNHVENKKEHKDCKDVHWSHHKGEEGPENWKNLCDGFKDCGGKSQSPIDIQTTNVKNDKELSSPEFHYSDSKVDIINNGHTVQFNVTGDNFVKLNGKDYKLLQFHYHALSEHTIDGKHFPMEVHFVHKNSDSDFAVIGAMIKEGKPNQLFEKYLEHFPTDKGEYKSDETFNILNLLPENKSYFYYSGSLTTPPCSEVVNWYVLKTPIEASKDQIVKFSKILNNNYRPVMPLNGRAVELFNE
ncbi:MAG TPA: carbonic anhydrase family protein [Bacteroidetes bacterium]|nr:carbonic anhydrase family protein [Bacteroidota bacterium]